MGTAVNKPGRSELPRHVAIIMDGNGRWAKKRGLVRSAGHAAGAETFRKITYYLSYLGVEYFTVYAFSTENWKRSEKEVSTIMALLKKFLLEAIDTMEKKGIRLKVLGDTSRLSPELRALIDRTNEISRRIKSGLIANLCINYGGRDEIIHAIKAWEADPERGELSEESFSKYLYTAGMPDPDLIIRPSGEYRLSNFLLWQCAYSEFYFTDTLWPDFNEAEMDKALEAYAKRERRYGNAK
ncbi:MAG: di-trans,poly-cis-decaprenylcistransferase [Oscillospiraceae bacterium]|nr:di-trans,poly-cis-decaprenylcistransferase [Oscillospiraceae bacterium]MBQ3986026.1 di-trans,poly-cis-decaprenylcistransferase [Oscillospiraceae bacterium]MBQ5504247.1 di-trans,poly-cis-decaprenylcistransferase [Oscillospiraceae bacterium]